MQKKIIALAIAAAFAAPVSAMAAAELYGTVDIGYVSQKNSTATTDVKVSGMAGGAYAYSTNNWGFKNSEDLGDGMKANIQIESGFDASTADGSAIGSRGISAGISADWGAIVLGGNQYSTSFKVNKAVDPFGYKFIGITGMSYLTAGTMTDYAASTNEFLPSGGRNDRDLAYTGKFGDVTVMAGRTFNRKVDSVKSGDASSLGAVYAAGDLTVAVSYTATGEREATAATTTNVAATNGGAFGANAAVTAQEKKTETSIGAAYKFGDITVNANRISYEEDTMLDPMVTMVIGASFKVSDKIGVAAGMYKTDVDSYKARNLKLVSATYALSKKTTMYAQYNTAKTSDDANSSKGFGAGLSVGF